MIMLIQKKNIKFYLHLNIAFGKEGNIKSKHFMWNYELILLCYAAP